MWKGAREEKRPESRTNAEAATKSSPQLSMHRRQTAVNSLSMLLKAKTWLVKVMPFLARWGSNTTPNP
jgi:hypothetical protein